MKHDYSPQGSDGAASCRVLGHSGWGVVGDELAHPVHRAQRRAAGTTFPCAPRAATTCAGPLNDGGGLNPYTRRIGANIFHELFHGIRLVIFNHFGQAIYNDTLELNNGAQSANG